MSVLIAFVGPSGVGKTTAYRFAHEHLLAREYIPVRVDVAEPLREIQAFAYRRFGRSDPGNPRQPDVFQQDGKLLQALAQHFEGDLGPDVTWRVQQVLKLRPGHIAVINTDCRDNAYPALKALGFTFVRLEAESRLRTARRLRRGDLNPADPDHPIERTWLVKADYHILNEGSETELSDRIAEVIAAICDRDATAPVAPSDLPAESDGEIA